MTSNGGAIRDSISGMVKDRAMTDVILPEHAMLAGRASEAT